METEKRKAFQFWDTFRFGEKPFTLRSLRRSLLFPVLPVESLYATRRVNEFLLSGEKRMAIGADFHVEVAHRGTGFKRITADARNDCSLIRWMNSGFHVQILCSFCSGR